MRNLLLLEEDAEGRGALARVLKRRGFLVAQAKDQSAALSHLSSARPVDLVLAGATYRDRVDFLADLREARPNLPIIFLSDYCAPESRLRGLTYGAFSMSRRHNFYLNMRPVGLDELERLIRIVLGKRRFDQTVRLAAA